MKLTLGVKPPCVPCLALGLAVLALAGCLRAADALFPLVLPWDDATPGPTDLSGWLHPPAGSRGPVRVGDDGHFQVGKERLRFFGVNMSFAGGLPTPSDAAAIAGRLAKFGVNVVRFHHLDTRPWPDGIRQAEQAGTGRLHPEALERLCAFVARLKEVGIYANINLLVGRPFTAGDGLPKAIESMDWKDRHVIGFFNETHQERQREFARALLRHRSPHMEGTLAEDPAVAFVEINNENGLVHAWLGGVVDEMPSVFQEELRHQWNRWLAEQHETTAALRSTWGLAEQAMGGELLKNGTFNEGIEGWTLEQHGDASARIEAVRGGDPTRVRLTVARPGNASWHVQLRQAGFAVAADQAYTLSFRARADLPRGMRVSLSQAHSPWQSLGWSQEVDLLPDWQSFRYVFRPSSAEEQARVVFGNLGPAGAVTEWAEVSLRPGGVSGLKPHESLEASNLPLMSRSQFGERTLPAQRDWMRFLWQTESAYWQSMYDFLKRDLGVRALVTGTIVGCTTPHLAARMDWVDTHAYWQHPRFAHRPWDPVEWRVENRSMVDDLDNTLPRLARKRVFGKPHAVTEYNHAAPNTYGSEAFVLLAAYAALQDWDAIYVYSYAHSRHQGWDLARISGFFDIDQHPTKMATLPAASALFRRGDVRPAQKKVAARLDRSREIELLRQADPWTLVDAGSLGVARETALLHQIGLAIEGMPPSQTGLMPGEVATLGPPMVADTRELTWDLPAPGQGVVTINTHRTKAVVGHGGGRSFPLGDILVEPGFTLQKDWSVIVLTALELGNGEALGDPPASGAKRWLVTATGYADNTGLEWKSTERASVGRNWGEAPSRVEGIPVAITFPGPVDAWALDARGHRRLSIPVEAVAGGSRVSLGPRFRALWYEVNMR